MTSHFAQPVPPHTPFRLRIRRPSLRTVLLHVSLILMVIASGSLWARNVGYDKFLAVALCASFLPLLSRPNMRIRFWALPVIALLVLQWKTGNLFFATAVGICVKILLVSLLLSTYSVREIWLAFRRVVVVLAILSLFAFFWYNFARQLVPIPAILRQPLLNGKFTNMIFAVFKTKSHMAIVRNQSIFWEPGAYQFFLNLALMVNFHFNRKLLRVDNVVLALALLSTFSTTGYLLFVVIASDLAFAAGQHGRGRKLLLAVLLLLLMVVLIGSNTVVDKFSEDNSSFIRRVMDATIDLHLIQDSWFWGYGRDNPNVWADAAFREFGLTIENISTSNHLLGLFSQFGIVFALIYLAPLVFFPPLMRCRWRFLLFAIVVLATENFPFSAVFVLLLLGRRKAEDPVRENALKKIPSLESPLGYTA